MKYIKSLVYKMVISPQTYRQHQLHQQPVFPTSQFLYCYHKQALHPFRNSISLTITNESTGDDILVSGICSCDGTAFIDQSSSTEAVCGCTASLNRNPPDPNLGYPVSFITGHNECSGGCMLDSLETGHFCTVP